VITPQLLTPTEAGVLRKVAWRLIPFMGLLYLLAFLDRVNVGFAALTMNTDLGFPATVFGTGAGIFFVGYVVFGVPSNLMLYRFGARRWIAVIMLTWGAVSGTMAFVRLPLHFYALRLLLGMSEAGFFPGMILYLAYWFPRKERARILGAFMVALPLSSVIGAPISAALLDVNAYGLKGWQWLFLCEGIPAMAVGALVLTYLTDRPEEAQWLTPQERAILIHSLRDPTQSSEQSSARGAFTQPTVWALSVVYFALLVGLYGYNFWLPQIIQSLGTFSHRQIGGLAMFPNLAAVLLMYAWAAHSDAMGEHRWHVALPLLLAAGGLTASAYLRDPTVSMMALTVGAVGIYCALPVFWSLPSTSLRGASAAAGIALINTIGNVGGFVGSSAMGYLKQATHGFADGLLLLAVCVVAAALLSIWTGKTRPRPEEKM
jgi:ACS family tartrate transporter-like MFS transporter